MNSLQPDNKMKQIKALILKNIVEKHRKARFLSVELNSLFPTLNNHTLLFPAASVLHTEYMQLIELYNLSRTLKVIRTVQMLSFLFLQFVRLLFNQNMVIDGACLPVRFAGAEEQIGRQK